MIYHVETTARFDRELRKLDRCMQHILGAWNKKIWKAVLIQSSMGKD